MDVDDDRPIRALLVDDDPAMQRVLGRYLKDHSISVTAASKEQETLRLLSSGDYQFVILDLQLGADDGLNILRKIRTENDVPVIIITGHRRDEIDRVVGLELGADDYMTKPFGLRELLARIRAVLRRNEASRTVVARDTASGVLSFGGWVLDRRSQRLTNPEGIPVELTKGEFALLIAFLDAPQRPLSREYLLQTTRIHEDIYDRSIDVQILRLRRKLEADSSSPRIIQTKRGLGYAFVLPVKRSP